MNMKRYPEKWILLLTAILLASCADNADTITNTESAGDSAAIPTIPMETADPLYETDLAVRDFSGMEFVIAVNDNPNIHHTIIPESETADMLNDALFQRNRTIEETYNINLIEYAYDYQEPEQVKNAVTAGDDAYDLVMVTCPDALSWWKEGLLIPFDELENINLEKGYWDQSINESLSIGGVQYIAEGAFNLDIYDLTFCLLFNKTLAEKYDIEDLYSQVSDGKWTYDVMLSAMQLVIGDINGDGEMTDADQYGYTAHPKMVTPGLWIGAGVTSIAKDENDTPYINMSDERFVNVFNKIFELVHDSEAAYLTEGDQKDIPTECRLIFEENRSLFIDMSFYYIEAMRGMDTDFGIIPYPKYDEAQEDYHARVCYYFPVVVPVTNADMDGTGYILEILNYRSYHDVIPAYYDVALKTKGARDEASAEMLDLIFDARVIDIGDSTLCDVIRDDFIHNMMKKNNRDLVSMITKKEKTINKRLETITQ